MESVDHPQRLLAQVYNVCELEGIEYVETGKIVANAPISTKRLLADSIAVHAERSLNVSNDDQSNVMEDQCSYTIVTRHPILK